MSSLIYSTDIAYTEQPIFADSRKGSMHFVIPPLHFVGRNTTKLCLLIRKKRQ